LREAACACKTDPAALHGPYIQWARTVDGKTVTRYLSEAQLARYQPWFDNVRRLKDLIAKLEIASVHALEASEQLAMKTAGATPSAARTRRAPAPPLHSLRRPAFPTRKHPRGDHQTPARNSNYLLTGITGSHYGHSYGAAPKSIPHHFTCRPAYFLRQSWRPVEKPWSVTSIL